MKVIGVIQCRMSSVRLPGKAIKILRHRTVLEWVILRSLRASLIDQLVLATTNHLEDDVLAKLGAQYSLPIIRGSKDNLLYRYADVMKRFPADAVVRITGDNPLTSPETIDKIISYFFANTIDYCYAAQLPYGSGVDIFHAKELFKITQLTKDSRHLEHINTYFLDNHLFYRISSLQPDKEYRRPDVRLTLDTTEDYERLQILFQILKNPLECNLVEIIEAYDRLPESQKYRARK